MKKILILFIATLMIIPTAMKAQTAETSQLKSSPSKISSSIKKGDINGDGDVSVTDVMMLVEYILTGNPQDIDLSRYDVDGDGEPGITDVPVLVMIIMNGE